jgi:hypothetical protein
MSGIKSIRRGKLKNRWIIIVIVGIILTWFVIGKDMTPTQINLLEQTQIPSAIEIYHLESLNSYANKEVIESLSSIMRAKVAKIDRNHSYEEYRSRAKLSFNYGYKGRSFFVDDDGRIVTAYRKYEFARDSWYVPYRLTESSNASFVFYITDPDESVKALVERINQEIGI